MKFVRHVARPLLGGIFILSGLDVLANPEPRAKAAKPVVDAVAGAVPIAPRDPMTAVTLNAVVHLSAGTLLAAGIVPRLAAMTLAASLVPTTFGGHRFWEISDPAQRAQQQAHFLKNAAILGGLLIAAFD